MKPHADPDATSQLTRPPDPAPDAAGAPTIDSAEGNRSSGTAAPPTDPQTVSFGPNTPVVAGLSTIGPAARRPQPGKPPPKLHIFGDYEILGELARGGMGVVYKARQINLNRVVALKMILAGQLASVADVRRFHAEAEAAAELHHPNIVAIHQIGEIDGQHYFSMDFVDGKSLSAVARKHPLPPRQAARYVGIIAEAIHHAHLKGIVHRDLKPANVLIDQADQPRVTDFGLAKRQESKSDVTAAEALTRTGQVLGTPSYMPPEQARGERVGPWADIYSLGAILYELLTGRAPFVAGNTMDTLAKVMAEEPEVPRRLNPKIPLDLQTICLKCLQKEPAARYTTAEALAEDLQRYIKGDPIVARPVGRWERCYRWTRRHPARAAALALGLTIPLLVAIGGVFAHLWREAEVAKTDLHQANQKLMRGTFNHYAVLAGMQLQDGDAVRAQALLDIIPEPFRDFEWYHLQNHLHPMMPLWGHNAKVNQVIASPDGLQLASLSDDKTIRLWDAKTGARQDPALKGLNGPVMQLAYAGGGLLYASSSPDGTVKIWDANKPKLVVTLEGHKAAVTDVAWSAAGSTLATAYKDGAVKIWNAATGKEIAKAMAHREIRIVALSPDNKQLASAGADGIVKLWDLQTHKELANLDRHRQAVTHLVYSRDGRRLASASKDGTIILWDTATGKDLATLRGHKGAVYGAAISPDGQRLASAGADARVRLWDAGTGKELANFDGHKLAATAVAFCLNGRQLASASADKTIMLWDTDIGKEIATLAGHKDHVMDVVYSPDGRHVVSGSADHTVKVWQAKTGKLITTLAGHKEAISKVAFSPDGGRLATAGWDGIAKLWNTETFTELATLTGHELAIKQVVFRADGRQLATCSFDKTIKLWDGQTGAIQFTLTDHHGEVEQVIFNPAGTQLASASWDKTIKLWDTEGKLVATLEGHHDKVLCVAFSPDGKHLASASADKTVILWDVRTKQRLATLKTGWVSNVVFSPDGKQLATFKYEDEEKVKLWDADTGKQIAFPLAALVGHRQPVMWVAYSPNGERLASASRDGTIKLWDTKTGLEVATLTGHEDQVMHVAFSPDGHQLASASYDKTVRLWYGKLDARVWEERKLEMRQQDGK